MGEEKVTGNSKRKFVVEFIGPQYEENFCEEQQVYQKYLDVQKISEKVYAVWEREGETSEQEKSNKYAWLKLFMKYMGLSRDLIPKVTMREFSC